MSLIDDHAMPWRFPGVIAEDSSVGI